MRKFVPLFVAGLMTAGAAAARAGVSVDINVNSRPRPVYVQPGYGGAIVERRLEQVWVPARTETVPQDVWHEPVTQDRVDRAWVGDRYEVRDVPVTGADGLPATLRQSVLVEPAHWQDVRTPVVVRAGYYGPEAQTVVVRPGYWQTVERPVVVPYGPPPYGPVVVVPPYREDRFRAHYDDGPRHDRGRGPGDRSRR